MPQDDLRITSDLDRGFSFISQQSWNEKSPTSRTFAKKPHSFENDSSLHSNSKLNMPQTIGQSNNLDIQQESRAIETSKTDRDSKIGGTVDDLHDMTLSRHAHNFVENVGVQGVRYIFMRDAYWLRRLLWILVCLTAWAYCSYVTVMNWKNYSTYPTATKTEVHYTTELPFPAITICNYNIFQKYKLSEEQIEMLEDMYKPYPHFENETGKDPTRYDHINMKELMINSSFEYLQNIGICFYKGRACNYSYMYTEMRDIGVCLTFDPKKSDSEEMKYQILPGQQGGFSYGSAVWEDNWVHGPFMNYDGFIVVIHDPSSDVVILQDHGTTLPVGHTTNLIITKREVNLLPPPHGQCGTKKLKFHAEYSEEACWLECNTNNLVNACGCRHPYMPGNDSVKYCNNLHILECKKKMHEQESLKKISCDCPPSCRSTTYDIIQSVTSLTEGTRNYVIENYDGFDMKTTGVLMNVYYSALSYKTETQEATYTVEKLLCDIGGAAGLFLGASFMSGLEVLDFIMYVLYLLSAKFWHKPNNTQRTSGN